MTEIRTDTESVKNQIMTEYPDCEIISEKNWLYPLFKQKVKFVVSSIRTHDILEEYVMKAAKLDIDEVVDIEFLSKLLGFDEVFLEACINRLADKRLIFKDKLPVIVLTDYGEKHLVNNTFPDDEQIENISFYIDKKSGMFYISPVQDKSAELWDKYSIVAKNMENVKKYISRKFLCDVAAGKGMEIEAADGSRRITSMVSAKLVSEARTLIAEFKVKNHTDGSEKYVIWDYAANMFRKDLEDVIGKYA